MVTTLSLSAVDIAILSAFLAGLLYLGFSARLRDSSVLQYLAAGRNLTLPLFVATLVSTWYGGVLGMGESVSYFGLGTWVLMGLPYYVFALLYAFGLARRVRGAEQISIPERLEARFGRIAALIGALLVFALAIPAAHLLMLGVLGQMLTGWSLAVSVVVGAVAGAAMLIKGGLLADARVSLLAFTMMYVGFAAIVIYCLTRFPPPVAFGQMRDTPVMTWDGGAGWPFVLSFFILGAWTLVDPGFHQRVASAASREIGRRGVLVSVGFWVLFDLLTITTGLYAIALLREPPANPLMIFPALGDAVLPQGLKAIFVCGMLGTIVSAMIGYALVSGATLGREIVCRVRPATSDGQVRWWTQVGLVVSMGVAVVLALTVESVVALWYSWAGALIGALLLPVLVAYGWFGRWKVSGGVVAVAMAVAAVGALAWMGYGLATGNPFLEVKHVAGEGWVLPREGLPEGLAAKLATAQGFSIGTLAPGLVVSALMLGLGAAVTRRRPPTIERLEQ